MGHSLTTADLMYGVRCDRGLQWYSVYTDDGESWDLSRPPFHCSSVLYSIKFWQQEIRTEDYIANFKLKIMAAFLLLIMLSLHNAGYGLLSW